jgi:hypothetical protein
MLSFLSGNSLFLICTNYNHRWYKKNPTLLYIICHYILLILQCLDWLAAFHLDMLQAILFIAV